MTAEYGPGDRLLVTLLTIAALYVILPMFLWATTVVLLVVILTGCHMHERTHWQRMGIPCSDVSSFMLGNTLEVIKKGHLFDVENFKRFEHTYGHYYLGSRELVSMDLEILKSVFVKDFHHFEDTIAAERNITAAKARSLTSNMLFLTTGSQWKRIRDRITPAFTTGKIKKVIPLYEQSVTGLCRLIDRYIEAGQEIPLEKSMGLLALDMASRSALGQDIHAFDSYMETPFHHQAKMILDDFLNIIAARVGFPFFLEKLRDCLGVDLSVTSSTHFFHGILETLYEQRRADPQSSQNYNDLLQLMLNAEVEAHYHVTDDSLQCLSKTELLAQCITFMAAGYETTGSLLQFALYHIACLPEVQHRLQKEIDTVLADSEHVTYTHVINMPYLSQVISEALRIAPPVVRAGRKCNSPVTIKGIPFEKGDMFVMPVYAMHHNETYYPDPEKFDPDRFSPDNKASRDPMTYVPFGAGPRTCIGMRLSEFGTHTALAVLLRRYRFKPGRTSPSLPVEVVSKKLLLKPKEFLYVVATKRRVDDP